SAQESLRSVLAPCLPPFMPSLLSCSARLPRHVRLTPVCPVCLLDHLVHAEQERRRYRNPKRLGSLEIDHQLERGGLLHRQIRRFGALQDAIYVGRDTPLDGGAARVIRHEATRDYLYP